MADQVRMKKERGDRESKNCCSVNSKAKIKKSRVEEVNGWKNIESKEFWAQELNEGVWTEPRSEGVTHGAGAGRCFVRAF